MLDKQTMMKQILEPDDRMLFAKVLDQASLCMKRNEAVYTDFLNPVQLAQFCSILGQEKDIAIDSFGGFEESERNMMRFVPCSLEVPEEYPIACLHIVNKNKFGRELAHRDYLGSILGIGIDRSKIGDILVKEMGAYCFVHADIASYVETQLEKVGRSPVQVQSYSESQISFEIETEEVETTVSSLRLDVAVSSIFRFSRKQAGDLVRQEKIFVNHACQVNGAKTIKEGDLLTVRGYGRVRLLAVLGETKKGKIRVKMQKFV